jgi:hypothetical protein
VTGPDREKMRGRVRDPDPTVGVSRFSLVQKDKAVRQFATSVPKAEDGS